MGRKHIVFYFKELPTFCYCMQSQSSKVIRKSMSIHWHSLRDHLCPIQLASKRYARHSWHHGLQARCIRTLLWSLVSLKFIESVNCSYVCIQCTSLTHTALLFTTQYVLSKTNIHVQVHKMPVCSHSSVDTHTGSVGNIIIVCELQLHVLWRKGCSPTRSTLTKSSPTKSPPNRSTSHRVNSH